jgi:hypothetical protein
VRLASILWFVIDPVTVLVRLLIIPSLSQGLKFPSILEIEVFGSSRQADRYLLLYYLANFVF